MSCLQLSHFALHHKFYTLHQNAGESSTALLDWEQPLVFLGGRFLYSSAWMFASRPA